MKKYLFAIAAVAAVLLAGCQKEEFSAPESNAKESGKVVLKATVNNGTRSTVSEDGMFAWAEDDVIDVMTDKGTFTPFNLTDGSGTYKATFTSVEPNVKAEKVAVFPAGVSPKVTDKKLSVTLPWQYVYVPDRTNSPMAAVIPEGDGQPSNVEFKHLCGLLAVTYNHVPQGLPSGAKYFYVRAEKKSLWGTFSVDDYTAPDAAIKTSPVSGYSALRFEIPDGTTFEGQTTFYAPIPVGVYDSLTVGLLDADFYYMAETKRVYTNVNVERCDMRTTSFDNLAWNVTYDYRGVIDQRTDGHDVIRFWNIPGKWNYTYMQHTEFNSNHYAGDIEKMIQDRVTVMKATNAKLYEGNYRINFLPFPPKQTFHIIAFQVDDEGNFTGNYLHRSWTPKEKESCSEGYNKWLGTWLVTGKDAAGNDSTYTLTITNKSNDELYNISGWAQSSTAYQGWYDSTTGNLVIRTYYNQTNSRQTSDGVTYDCRGGLHGATANGFQSANTILCTGTIDETGTTATLEGYTYYTNSPFVTMAHYWYSYDINPSTGRPLKGWYNKKAETLIHFPATLTKVEID